MSRIWYTRILTLGRQKFEPRVGHTSSNRMSGLDLNIPLFQGGSVMRLSMGRRLVNLSPVAQRTNALTCVIRFSLGRRLVNLLPVAQRTISNALMYGVVERTWAAGREFESRVHHENAFIKKSESPHVKNLRKYVPSLGSQKLEPRAGDTSTRISGLDLNIPPFQGGGVVRLSLDWRSDNLSPVAQRMNAWTSRC